MARKAVPVSRLADYVSDPDGFIARRGGVRNKRAARAGVRHHDALGRRSPDWVWVLVAVLVAGLLLFAGGVFA